MSNALYLQGRKKYSRPQALLFANNPGTIEVVNPQAEQLDLLYIPLGDDLLSSTANESVSLDNYFMLLSDDNRQQLDFRLNRIEKRERMINGRMRSHHIADKLSLSVSWNMLPSRAAAQFPNFDSTGKSPLTSLESYTTDGGAGGTEILDWYEKHEGSFWVYLAYDKYNNLVPISSDVDRSSALYKYNQVVEMYFSDFSYSVVKRGGNNYDFWNITFTLEEV